MQTRQLWTVLVVAFIDLLGFSLIVPLIPFYAEQFGASPFIVGLLVASYAAAQVLGAPLIGRFSDRYGRRPALLITIFFNAVGFIVFGLANSLPLLFAGRILSGISGGNLAVAQAYIADITDAQHRARGLGMLGAAFGIGFIIGPALGGALSVFGYGVPALLAGGLSALNFIAAFAFVPESLTRSRRAEMRQTVKPRAAFSLDALIDALKHPQVGSLLNTRFFFAFAFNLFVTIFPLYAQYRFSLSAQQIGFVLTYVGILLVIVQAVLVGRMVARWGEYRLLLAMVVLTSLTLLGWAFSPNLPFLLAVFAPMALSAGSFNTLINSTLSKAVPPDEVGGILGLATALESFTRVFAPSLGGYLIGSLGVWSPGLIGAIVLALLALLTWRDFMREPQSAAVHLPEGAPQFSTNLGERV
jgi:DHA1 family tetracycline resistance protein-like MFS transporter